MIKARPPAAAGRAAVQFSVAGPDGKTSVAQR